MTQDSHPVVQTDWLERNRLLACLDEAANCPIVLVQAPAGFGKTTALVQWVSRRSVPCAWLTLTPHVMEPKELLPAIWHALDLSLSAQGVPCSPAPNERFTRADSELTTDRILNQLWDSDAHTTLVLDGVEHLSQSSLNRVVEPLIRHAGAGFRLIMLSRTLPDLPLSTCRLSARLGEVDREQLRLTSQEEADLAALWGLQQPWPSGWQPLASALNGWIAGWVMLRQRLRRQGTPCQAWEDIERYLHEVSLNALPPDMLNLLTTLSFCERLTDDLAAELSDLPAAADQLSRAEASGAFLARSPRAPGTWIMEPFYRQSLLRLLGTRGMDQSRALHARAAQWFLSQGCIVEALNHGLKGGGPKWLAKTLSHHGQALLDAGETALVASALEQLPEGALHDHPALGYLALQIALSKQDTTPFDQLTPLPPSRATPGISPTTSASVQLLRAQAALMTEDVTAAESCIRATSSFDAPVSGHGAILSACIRGELSVCKGHYRTALEHFEVAEGLARAHGHHQHALWAMAQQAEIGFYRGQLESTHRVGERFGHYMHKHHLHPTPATEHLLRVKVSVNIEWLRLEAAESLCHEALNIAREHKISTLPALTRLAALASLRGQPESARQWLDDAFELLYAPHCHSDWQTLYDQVWLSLCREHDEKEAVERWLYRNPPLSMARNHFEYRYGLNRQMALLLLGQYAQALEEGSRLSTGPADREAAYLRLQRLILSSLASWQADRPEQAQSFMVEALTLSEHMLACAVWLMGDVPDSSLPEILDSLAPTRQGLVQGALRVQELLRRARHSGTQSGRVPEDARRLALTRREWDVLEKVGEGLSNEQIANALFVAPSTVRSHLKSIYQKLGVHHREDARSFANTLTRHQAASLSPSSP
ncbi:MAG: hypothetical protein D6758_08340 [Gammaproteobacteria bacterium]|nr:MAG: hypothetical protein D6758_08340 [Gammaproteobacteria bacterium]